MQLPLEMNALTFAQISLATIVSLLFLLCTGSPLLAQDNYHVFTDKKGQAIEATPLSISPDKSKLQIRRKDGREFELPILALSLDDQQYIKDWLKTTAVKSDFTLEVSVTKHQENTKRINAPNSQAKWLTDNTAMEIEIRNLSRADLTGASVEYYIAIEQGVKAVSHPEPGFKEQYGVNEWWYSNQLGGNKKKGANPLWLNHGKAKLQDLAYNHEATLKTEIFPLREIDYANSDNPNDTILGMIVRISDADGKEISIHRSTDNKILEKTWDKIAAMPPGNSSGIPPRSRPANR